MITVWDTYFNPLFAKVVDVVSTQSLDAKVRCAAANCLLQLIKNSRGISTKCSMLVNRLIDVQLACTKDLALSKAIENCTIELARAVDIGILLPILRNIIKAPDQSSQKSAAAVKIISHAISRLQESEALELVNSIVPMVFQVGIRGGRFSLGEFVNFFQKTCLLGVFDFFGVNLKILKKTILSN